MACKHPLKGFQIGITKNGKPQYKITSFDVTYIFKSLDKKDSDSWSLGYDQPIYIPGWKFITDFIQIPCGQCIGCRLAYSRLWADRCVFESKYHDSNYFLTLTYDDDHLVDSIMYDSFLDCEYVTPTLYKRDLQLFFKRMRKAGYNFRYFACGEYGGTTFRPHYHLCMFGLEIDDLTFYKNSFDGSPYYNSEKISNIWGNGFVVICPFSWETAAYTARYCTKKINNDLSAFYDSYNIEKEFTLMSRKPGLGYQYYEDNIAEIYDDDRIYMTTKKGVQSHKPPRYFDKIFEKDFPDEFGHIKENRKEMAERLMELKLENTSLNYVELLQLEENKLLEKNKKLKRKEV